MDLVSGNIFIRSMVFEKAGDGVKGHRHNFDHTLYCPHGALRVEIPDDAGNVLKTTEISVSHNFNWVLIRAGVVHIVTALEDGSVGHCIYSHRNPQGEVVQEYDGWTPGYV